MKEQKYEDQVEGRNAVIELLEGGKDINKIYVKYSCSPGRQKRTYISVPPPVERNENSGKNFLRYRLILPLFYAIRKSCFFHQLHKRTGWKIFG